MSQKFWIKREVYDELEKAAKEAGYESVDDYVVDIVRKYIEKLEREG